MAIFAYTGLPGSGKSYGVVANQIMPALKEGRVVVTNIPLHEDKIREITASGELREFPLDKVAQQPDMIEEYAPPGCVLIIDEIWKLFPAGTKVDRVPEPFKKLLAEHRHMVDAQGRSMQIVFVTQDLSQIASFARQLVEQTFLHTKLGHMGLSGTYKCQVFHRGQTGGNPPSSALIRSMLGRYEANTYKLYKSHTMSQSATEGANETAADTRGNIWKRTSVMVSGVALVGVVIAIFAVVLPYFNREKPVKAAKQGSVLSPVSRAYAGTHVGERAVLPRQQLRVAMVLQSVNVEHSYALLVDGEGSKVWIPGKDCEFARMQWQCEYKGQFYTLQGLPRAAAVDVRPIGDSMVSAGTSP